MQTSEIRAENLRRVRAAFAGAESLVASQIAAKTALSVVTVNAVLEALCAAGQMTRLGAQRQGGGRPSVAYRYDRACRTAVVLYAYNRGDDIHLHGLAVNEFGEVLHAEVLRQTALSGADVNAMTASLFAACPRSRRLVLGFPGFRQGAQVVPADFSTFMDAAFLGALEARHGVPLTFLNDVNAAAYGYECAGADPLVNVAALYIARNYGPGLGIVINGRVYTGTGGFAGEVGCIPVPVPWAELPHRPPETIAAQLAALLVPVCCILAPQAVTLYSEYLDEAILDRALALTAARIAPPLLPKITFTRDFSADFRAGMLAYARQLLLNE